MLRTITQYGVFTFLGAAVILLLSFVIEKGINQVDEMLIPCQHGTSFIQGRCRCEGTPYNGTYCSNCMCEHGSCSTEPTTPFRNSDFGCRCPTQSKRFGFLCDLCNAVDDNETEACKGDCKPDFFGAKCERICYPNLPYDNNNSVCNTMRASGGQCHACNGHGTCEDGFCECDDNWFDDGRDECVKTCPADENNQICSGHGTCRLYGDTPGCMCEKGWNGPNCDLPCPGITTTGVSCNNRGICNVDFEANVATCECNEKFRGPDCSIECPGDVVACNGHGTCDDVGVCTCQTNVRWSQPSCKCSDELTCNAKGTCNAQEQCECFGNNAGQHCLECQKNWHGENCELYCDPYLKANVSDKIYAQFGCYGHGTCLERGGSMECTCNLDTTLTMNVDGAVNDYVMYYDNEMNCGECLDEYFPKQFVVNQYGMPKEYSVPCEGSCNAASCNNRGVCNHLYGAPGEKLCKCDVEHLDDESFCTECEANWYPLDFSRSKFCNRFCVASGDLPSECDGTVDCVQCNGHGTCTDEGDCLCADGYTGDQCQIFCTSSNGLICGGHGTCESNEIQQLMEHEFREEGGIPLFSCTCDPQDPIDADARIDWDEKLALGLVNGTLDPPPNQEYYGHTCDYHCIRPPWEDSDECNGLGNCSVVTIRAPNNADFNCLKDSDCLTPDVLGITSADEFWSNKKGPFCHKKDEISGCEQSTDNCYEILLKQRPKKMRTEECVTHTDIVEVTTGTSDSSMSETECRSYQETNYPNNPMTIMNNDFRVAGCVKITLSGNLNGIAYNTGNNNDACGTSYGGYAYTCIQKTSCLQTLNDYNWHDYCQNVQFNEQPALFSNCKSVASFCPAKPIPAHCKTLVDLTDGVQVSKKLNYHYEYEKRKYPFAISEEYRIVEHALKHDDAEAIIEKGLLDYKLADDFCSTHALRYPVIDTVRENKQYVCNGVVQNTTSCSGPLGQSENNLYYPFTVRCLNEESSYESYEEALLNQGVGCTIHELQKEHVFIESDGHEVIDNVCSLIENRFPSCNIPQPCDFNPCSDASYSCYNDGTKAVCSTTGNLNSTCLKGVSERLTYTSYTCDIVIPETSCPKKATFETNHAKHCLDNNPIVSHVDYIGENEVKPLTTATYIHFQFKASDATSASTVLEFGSNTADTVRIFVRQGQIQINEAETLRACPVTDPGCQNTWAYVANTWYHIELELNATHVRMTRKDTGATITKAKLSTAVITEVRTQSSYSVTQYREIVSERDIPSPYTCTYETCNFDVSYRNICSDIIRKVEYPSLLSPSHNILQTCSDLFVKTRHPIDASVDYLTTEKVTNTDWDVYCDFYNAFTDDSIINVDYTVLEKYLECQEFVDPVDGDKTCIDNALTYDWVTSCSNLYAAKIPQAIKDKCAPQCYNHLMSVEQDYCLDREELFSSGNMVKDVPGCSVDWYDYCLKDSKGTLTGKCSAVECTCDTEQYAGVSGEACELHCPVGFDGTACAEGSNMGKCTYTEAQKETIHNAPLDGEGNPKAFDPVWALEGECECFLSEGTRSCDIKCKDCNNGTYLGGQIGICNNARGTCECLPPFTTISSYTQLDWRGKNITVIERSYGDGGQQGRILYRIRQMQGKESFVKNELKTINLTTVLDITVSGTDHYVYNGENDPTISLCRGVEYTFHLPSAHPFRIVPEENCANKGCVDGSYLELPDGVGDYTGANSKHTFLQDGIYYYVCTNHANMVGKFIISTCTGDDVYDGTTDWRDIYNDFLSMPSRYWCYDAACDESDVTMLGNLDSTSSRYNYDCNKQCPGFSEVTQLACSGNGYCGVTGECICDTAKTTSESSAPVENVQFIPGVEVSNTKFTSNKLERTGFRGDKCEITCPGYDPLIGDMNSICNGHGTCDLAGQCACDAGYIGDECQFSCPMVDDNICTGHGTCEMAELTVSSDIYDGFSRSCAHYADIGHCEAYAILNDLLFINIANTKIVGPNEACIPISEEECKQWGKYQDLSYLYNGNESDIFLPRGCIINDLKEVNYNTMNTDVECGENGILCVCKSKISTTTYCSVEGNTMIVHSKGGKRFTEGTGLYEYLKIDPFTQTVAEDQCEEGNFLAIQEDPPASQTFYVVKSSIDRRTTYNQGYKPINADCNLATLILTIPSSVGMDVSLTTCSERCRNTNSYSVVTSGTPDRSVSESECRTYANLKGYAYDPTYVNTQNPPGCFLYFTSVYFNSPESSGDCGWNGHSYCIQLAPCNIFKLIMGTDTASCYSCSTQSTVYGTQLNALTADTDLNLRYPLADADEETCQFIANALDYNYRVVSDTSIQSGCLQKDFTQEMLFNTAVEYDGVPNQLRKVYDADVASLASEFYVKKFDLSDRSVSEEECKKYAEILNVPFRRLDASTEPAGCYRRYYNGDNSLRYNACPIRSCPVCSTTFPCVQKTNRPGLTIPECAKWAEYHSLSFYGVAYWNTAVPFGCIKNDDGIVVYMTIDRGMPSPSNGYYTVDLNARLAYSGTNELSLSKNECQFYAWYHFAPVKIVTSGLPTQSMNIWECKHYASINGFSYSDAYNNVFPTGCFLPTSTTVYFNTYDGGVHCGSPYNCLEAINPLTFWGNENHGSWFPRGCSFSGTEFYYNTNANNVECGFNNLACVQQISNNINNYQVQELVSGEKYKYFVLNPESLCIKESALTVESKTQAPVVKSLQQYNDMCRYFKVDGTCPMTTSYEQCYRYSQGSMSEEYDINKPLGCYVENGQFKWNHNVFETTIGIPNQLLSTDQCHEYAQTINLPVLEIGSFVNYAYKGNTYCNSNQWIGDYGGRLDGSTVDECKILCGANPDCVGFAIYSPDSSCIQCTSTSTSWHSNGNYVSYEKGTLPSFPTGCLRIGDYVTYNPDATNTGCSDASKCVQPFPIFATSDIPNTLTISQEQCEMYAAMFGDSNGLEVVDNTYPTGCFKTGNDFFYGSGSVSCSTTNTCVKELALQQCTSTYRCVCPSNLYMDESSGVCKAIEDKPIIKATFTQDRTTDMEQDFQIDCQVISSTTIQCAQCACFNDFIYGHWSGMECSTCAVGYGKSQCIELCPDYDGETEQSMCGGFGQCLFGSEQLDVERVFQEASCLCGQDEEYEPTIETEVPSNTYNEPLLQYSWFEPVTNGQSFVSENDAKTVCSLFNDINIASVFKFCYGVFKRDNLANTAYELHMGNTGTEFITYGVYIRKALIPKESLSYAVEERDLITKIGSSEVKTCANDFEIVETGVDKCNHFSRDSKSCTSCDEGWTGKNCRSKCQKCLLQGSCEGKPNDVEAAKCQCPAETGLWGYQCCPAGFRVANLIEWNSIPQSQIDQIKIQQLYDPYTTNDMDSAYYCKKCPGVFADDWMQSVAVFKVCSGATRGDCVINTDNQNLVCECKLNELTGNVWKGRACSCDDSLETPYSTIASAADSTDYGCVIPTGGTAVCPEPNPSGSNAVFWNPYMIYAIGRSIDGNYVGSVGSFNKYLGPLSRLSSPVSFTGGIASEIIVTTGVHGKCDEQTPCHTGEGPCIEDHDCAGGLLCNKRIGENANINGYNPTRASAGFKYCYDPLDNLIGCDPIPVARNFDGTDNFYNYKYWNGTSFASATLGNYVPMTKDGNNDLVIHKREFPCPKGKYGVQWDNQYECALCPAGYYQDQTGQLTCISGCGGGQLGVIDLNHCVSCDPGYEPSADFLSCEVCATGQYDDGTNNCESCPINTFQLAGVEAQSGPSACNQCPAGTSTENSVEFVDYTKLNTCLTCDNGKFNANVESSCVNCDSGKFSHDTSAIITKWGYGSDGVTQQECQEFADIYGYSTVYAGTLNVITNYANQVWNAGCFVTGSMVYYNSDLTSTASCFKSSTLTCIKKENYVIVPNGIASEVNYFYAHDGECDGTNQLKMYDSNSNVDYVNQCYEACLTKKTPLDGGSWTGFNLKGFVVTSTGKCYCEASDSSTCTKIGQGTYTRYDVGEFIDKISEAECKEMAGNRYYATVSRNEAAYKEPHGCMYDRRSTSSYGWYNTLEAGNDCDSGYAYCVKRARSGDWILQMPNSILHYSFDSISATSESDCKNKCKYYLFMSWASGTGCRCAQHNYGAGTYSGGSVYQRLPSKKTSCTNCLAGRSADQQGTAVCDACYGGKYQDQAGQQSCISCVAGTFSDIGQMHCGSCLAGSYQNQIGQTSCKSCTSGQYQDQTRQTSCKTSQRCASCTGSGCTSDAWSYQYTHRPYAYVGGHISNSGFGFTYNPAGRSFQTSDVQDCFRACREKSNCVYFQLYADWCYLYSEGTSSGQGGYWVYRMDC